MSVAPGRRARFLAAAVYLLLTALSALAHPLAAQRLRGLVVWPGMGIGLPRLSTGSMPLAYDFA